MNPQILTLFGEELAPEQMNAVGKSRAISKKSKDANATKDSKTANKKAVEIVSDILKGWNAEKQYYSIGEVASLFKVNTSHIRFWTKEFAIKVRTTRKGDRLYTSDQIMEIRSIYHLVKERGFTLAGAKAKLKEEKKGAVEAINLKQSLLKLRNQLISIQKQLS
jgi:DNA-binding transcriptional MerR regulator